MSTGQGELIGKMEIRRIGEAYEIEGELQFDFREMPEMFGHITAAAMRGVLPRVYPDPIDRGRGLAALLSSLALENYSCSLATILEGLTPEQRQEFAKGFHEVASQTADTVHDVLADFVPFQKPESTH